MASLFNMKENVLVELNPKFKDEFGVCCDFSVTTEMISFDYKDVANCEKYFSHQNILYLEKYLDIFTNVENYEEEEILFSMYPIDMFFAMDITKESDEMLSIELRIPMGVYTSARITGYAISIYLYDVELKVFYSFLKEFLAQAKNCESKPSNSSQ